MGFAHANKGGALVRFEITIGLVKIVLLLLQLVNRLLEGIVPVLYERSEDTLASVQATHAT